MHQPHVYGRYLENRDHVARIDGGWDDGHFAHKTSEVRRFIPQIGCQDIFRLQYPDGVVAITVGNRKAGMRALREFLTDDLRIIVEVDNVDISARCHHRADRSVPQPHDAGNHLLFAGLEHTRIFRLFHEMMNLFLGNPFLGLAAPAKQGKKELSRDIQQNDEWQRNFCEQVQHRRDPHGNTFRIAQRDLFRNQFADNKRRISDDCHDDSDAQHVGDAGRHANFDQLLREPLTERRARECAR